MRKAVIDVGSNSIILLVGEKQNGTWRFLSEYTRVTALGENTKVTGLLGEAGIVATLEALRDFFEIAHREGALDVQAWATMAARISKNAGEFLQRAKSQGTPVQILSGELEAQLGFESVIYDSEFAHETAITIIDPGGQSTELVSAQRSFEEENPVGHESGWIVSFRRSFPIGTLALRGDVLKDERPGPAELLRAIGELDDTIGMEYLPTKAGLAVVLGATGTNLISIREQYTSWEPDRVHGASLRYDEVSRFVSSLSEMGDTGRASLVGIEPGRERTVHLGALILERFMYMIHVLEVKVSVRGWRHALLTRGLPPLVE